MATTRAFKSGNSQAIRILADLAHADTSTELTSTQTVAALVYGQLFIQGGWTRTKEEGRMIAAHAFQTTSVLVTNNRADCRDVPGLSLANWTV